MKRRVFLAIFPFKFYANIKNRILSIVSWVGISEHGGKVGWEDRVSGIWVRLHRLGGPILGDLTPEQISSLILSGGSSHFVEQRRAALILSRVWMVALIFTLLTPLWIPIDLYIFPLEEGLALTLLRGLATLSFGLLSWFARRGRGLKAARRCLAGLLTVPTLFFLISHPVLDHLRVEPGAQQFIAAGYDFLPFVMMAGLGVFPITVLEGVLLGAPLILAKVGILLLHYQLLPFNSEMGTIWLLSLLGVVAILSGVSQLHFMSQLVSQASHDGLTKALTRRLGEEFLDHLFSQSGRVPIPLTVGFVDLDNFKSVNDSFGHEEGDRVLRNAAESLRQVLRRGDVLVRWGGEEFLVILPNADRDGSLSVFQRLRNGKGLGLRPDGKPQTASIGVASVPKDEVVGWPELVELADHRMYMAKTAGKDQLVSEGQPPTMHGGSGYNGSGYGSSVNGGSGNGGGSDA